MRQINSKELNCTCMCSFARNSYVSLRVQKFHDQAVYDFLTYCYDTECGVR